MGAFTSYSFPATGAPTARTVPAMLAEIVNVKDYGATGDGVTDDSAAIQAAIDAAFGSAGSPHGTNATLNRPLFFPNGNYLVNTPLVFTQVRGAHIYGAGQFTTTISGNTKALVTNGLEYCNFENLMFQATAGVGNVAVELDWDGTGSVGLKGNIFTNCTFNSGDYACRVAFSGNGGSNNQFYSCAFVNAAVAGFVTWSAGATGQVFQGGGAAVCATGYWIKAGQIATISDPGLANNTAQDILMDSTGPLLVKGARTESSLLCRLNNTSGVAVLDGCSGAAFTFEFCHTKGKAILDSCSSGTTGFRICSDASFTGTIYLRGCTFTDASYLTGFAGTVAQNI